MTVLVTMYGVQKLHTKHSMKLPLMKLNLIKCCLNTRIKINTNIIFFKIPVKIDKNTSNAHACYEKYGK